MKKLLPVLQSALLLAMLIGTVQISAAYDFASGGIYYTITSSTNMTAAVTYFSKTDNTYSGTVTIPEKVTYNGKTYYVTSIGEYAFIGCTGLKGVNFASTRTTTIGNYAFQGCNGITSFVIPPHITSIGNGVFNGCLGMTGLVIEESETTLSLGAGIIKSNSDVGSGLFRDCPLYSVFIGRPLSYSTNKSYGYSPFTWNPTLVKVHFGNPITYIHDYLFAGCSSLKTLVYNSQCKPTTIGKYAFWGCSALTEEDISYPESVTTIGEAAFNKCTSLSSYTIPNHVTKVGDYAFAGCTRLANIIIKPSVTSIGNYAFNGCTALTSVTIEESETTLSLGWNLNNETADLGKGLFYDCPLYSVFIGRPLSYSTYNYRGYSPFANNNSLVKVQFGNPITRIYNYLFAGCSSLKTLVYNSQCKPTTIGKYAFWGCTALTESDIRYPESVTTIDEGAFKNCTSITSYTIPNHVTTVGSYAFQNCSRLSNLVIKPSVTSIGNYAFNGCTALTSVTIEESETTLSLGAAIINSNNDVGSGLFRNCPLYSVFIGRPLSYSTVKSSGYSPFANNLNLVKARLGKKLASIPNYLFYGCTYLSEVTSCAATPPTANTNCFQNYNAQLYVPKNSANAYRTANVWKNFTSITGVDVGDDDEPIVPGSIYGDVNGDGIVSISDVTELIQYLMSL